MDRIRLLRHADVEALGMSSRRAQTALADGTLVRVRPGVFALGQEWSAARPEVRVIARAHAHALTSSTAPVSSHETAAALHGLPLHRPNEERVHTIAPAARPGAARGIIRHRGDLAEGDEVEIDGLRVTSLARTVADVVRTASFEQAVTIADAALRRQFVTGPGRYDAPAAEDFRRTVLSIAQRSAHGQSRARRALEFADGRAQLPGESISRIRLHELGFRVVDLQIPVSAPTGGMFYVDFGLEREHAFGEFDGAMKYVDARMVDGRTSFSVFDEEKQREDWIRGTTQRRYVRWGWPHLRTAEDLGARLEAFGIHPVR